MRAYDESYLADAKDHLGDMFDYAVNTLGMDIRDIFERFAYSGTGEMFEYGHPLFLAGMCGSDLARRVLENTGRPGPYPDYEFTDYSQEYWAGWVLAHFQWYSGISFKDIDRYGLPIEEVVRMYYPLHEADISKFLDIASRRVHVPEPNLKEIRKAADMTQARLAELSGVPLRLIRAYEQGTVPLSHAEAGTVVRLERVLRRRLV
ncbi:MAG: helix-turn-helix transcriptional regulator [Bacteroidales bacterium]|nr:helix-turn-helix transcriptional regulator [Bacteroidales bacterium]